MVRRHALALALGICVLAPPAAIGTPEGTIPSLPIPAYGSYAWPVSGPVIRGFEPPAGPYAAGHRGIDIASPSGSRVHAAAAGLVAFAGRIAGELHVSIDHPDGVRTSYAFLGSVLIERGTPIERGAILGTVGTGHPGVSPGHLHFGARYAGQYIDPMLLLERGSLVGLIHLAPIEEGEARAVP